MLGLMVHILVITNLNNKSFATGAKTAVVARGAGSMVSAPPPDHGGDGFYTTGRLGREILPRLCGAVGRDMGVVESDRDEAHFVEVHALRNQLVNFEEARE